MRIESSLIRPKGEGEVYVWRHCLRQAVENGLGAEW